MPAERLVTIVLTVDEVEHLQRGLDALTQAARQMGVTLDQAEKHIALVHKIDDQVRAAAGERS